MKEKISFSQVLVLGFALFAMFFGAGNLIFPPSLGITCGENWLGAFGAYILVDAGLAMLALIASFRCDGGLEQISQYQLGRMPSLLLIAMNALCLGPLVAIPRTASTTFEIAFAPLLPGLSSWVFALIYFAIVVLLCLKPGKVVDIIGKVLSPVMFVALLVLIGLGVLFPLGSIEGGLDLTASLKMGLENGYQTMDMLGGLLFAVVTMMSVTQMGFTQKKSRLKIVSLSGLFASGALFLVYGGLAYLGATASTLPEMQGLPATALLLSITHALTGSWGGILLGVIVAAACLTTAIGLVSSCAETFVCLSNGKLPYKPLVIGFSLISLVLSNLGTGTIIAVASPILEIIYPIFMILMIFSFFQEKIHNRNIFKGAVLMALGITLMAEIGKRLPTPFIPDFLPLYELGLYWILPAVLGGLLGALIPEKPKKQVQAAPLSPQTEKTF